MTMHESYRKNFPRQAERSPDLDKSTDPHWVAFKSGWIAADLANRKLWRDERSRRLIAEQELTRIITPQ